MDEAVQDLLDREAVRSVVALLARGEDRRDADLLKRAFWPDSTFDYGVYKGGFAEYLAWVVPGAESITNTQHVLGQTYVELDGSTARAETHVLSYHRVSIDGAERDTVIGGRYLDELEKREGRWAIRHRTMLYDWFQDWGAAADWGQGVMGYPFHGDHYTGTAKEDWSKVFFARR